MSRGVLLLVVALHVFPLAASSQDARGAASQQDIELPSAPTNAMEFAQYLMSVSQRAEDAKADGDYARAVQYFSALAEAVPNRAVSYRKMCECYLALGDRENALNTCDDARGKEGATVEDQVSYLRVLISGKEPLTAEQAKDAKAVVAHLRDAQTDEALLEPLLCEVASKTHDSDALKDCAPVESVSVESSDETGGARRVAFGAAVLAVILAVVLFARRLPFRCLKRE